MNAITAEPCRNLLFICCGNLSRADGTSASWCQRQCCHWGSHWRCTALTMEWLASNVICLQEEHVPNFDYRLDSFLKPKVWSLFSSTRLSAITYFCVHVFCPLLPQHGTALNSSPNSWESNSRQFSCSTLRDPRSRRFTDWATASIF